MPVKTPGAGLYRFSSKLKGRHIADWCITSSTDVSFASFSPLPSLFFFPPRPATPVNYTWFLQSLGQDRVELATFPSWGSLIAEMYTFSATSEQDADRISSYKGGLTAGGLVFVLLMLPRKDLKQLWKQNPAQTSKVNRWRRFSCKTPRSSESQTSITS